MGVDLQSIARVYFLGIGGIGMSALARYFRHLGAEVAGYDLMRTALTESLAGEGIAVHYEDSVDSIPSAYRVASELTLVVYTPAVPRDNAEVRFFLEQGHRLVKRAEVLGLIAAGHTTLAVAGAHGKTTTSTLLAHLLGSVQACNAVLGGVGVNLQSNLLLSGVAGAPLVVEADEYDRSFLQLHPDVTVITSVAPDHLDVYGTYEAVQSAFRDFAMQNRRGHLIAHVSSSGLFSDLGLTVQTYGMGDPSADYWAEGVRIDASGSYFRLHSPHRVALDLHLGIPGVYNVENALGALAAADAYGVGPDRVVSALASFRGVQRRFEVRYASDRVVYVDDYAHHPDELRAFILAAREVYAGRRLLGIFQPHLYTRTRDFASEFADALSLLDEVWILPIYPAREAPIEGVSSEWLLEQMGSPVRKRLIDMGDLLAELCAESHLDVVLTMGAGSIGGMTPAVEGVLRERG